LVNCVEVTKPEGRKPLGRSEHRLDLCGSEKGQAVGSCGFSDSVKGKKFLD
jgi:hypothetical protein